MAIQGAMSEVASYDACQSAFASLYATTPPACLPDPSDSLGLVLGDDEECCPYFRELLEGHCFCTSLAYADSRLLLGNDPSGTLAKRQRLQTCAAMLTNASATPVQVGLCIRLQTSTIASFLYDTNKCVSVFRTYIHAKNNPLRLPCMNIDVASCPADGARIPL